MNFQFESTSGFKLEAFPIGPLQCNCSLIWDPKTLEAVLVDPGDEADRIQSRVSALQLKVKAIIHTHAHFDHVGASKKMHEVTNAPLLLHPGDKMLWDNVLMQGQAFQMHTEELPPWNEDLEHEKSIQLGRFKLKTLFTPGHTPGSCCFSIDEILFAGDTLFQGSIGRTDLWGGDFDQISKSIKDRLYILDKDTTVICGHGPNTKIGIETRSNPFVNL